ncbi:MAG: BNR-4 repeat-containing protein [Bacteroidales bacterium]|nr:BNR-4 repeat-containing protein [Bacteroidales bacterium]
MRPTRIEIAFLLLILPAIISCGGTSGSKEASFEYTDEIINQKAEGYSGIWYQNTPLDNEYRFKYSGGLGTYCAKHRPFAIYAEKVDKTFFCYGAAPPDLYQSTDLVERHHYPAPGLLLHAVGYFDHETGMVCRPTYIMDKGTGDAHDNPVISLDDGGYIWIFSTSHGRSRPSYIHRSRDPFKIDSFERIPAVQVLGKDTIPFDNFSYFQPWHIPGRGFMVFATRYNYPVDRTPCYLTSRDGMIWSPWQRIATLGVGHYQVSTSNGVKSGTMLNYHPEVEGDVHGLNFRTNLYYLETSNIGRTWQTAGGERLSLPLKEIQNPALVHDYRSDSLLVYLKDLQFDEEGNPVLLYITSPGYVSGPENDPRTWTLAHWNGTEWRISEITTSDNNYDAGELILYPDRWILIAPTETGPQPYNPGGELAMWETQNKGENWKKTGQITVGSEYNHTYVRRVLDAHPDFLALWADGHGRQPSNSRLYFINQHDEVHRLPFHMGQDFEKPERIH